MPIALVALVWLATASPAVGATAARSGTTRDAGRSADGGLLLPARPIPRGRRAGSRGDRGAQAGHPARAEERRAARRARRAVRAAGPRERGACRGRRRAQGRSAEPRSQPHPRLRARRVGGAARPHAGERDAAYQNRAIAALEIARANTTADLSIDLTLARLYLDADRPGDAVPLLRRIVDEQPQFDEGSLLLSSALRRSGHADEAADTLTRARQTAAALPRARAARGALRAPAPLGTGRRRLGEGAGREPAQHDDCGSTGHPRCSTPASPPTRERASTRR